MTQQILIQKNHGTPPPKFIVYPNIASVWRNDQTVTWILAGGLFWDPPPDAPAPENLPVFFLPEDETHSAWPSDQPSPLGQLTGNEQDKRLYVAFAGVIIPTGELPVTYHWAAWVNDGAGRERIQMVHPTGVLI